MIIPEEYLYDIDCKEQDVYVNGHSLPIKTAGYFVIDVSKYDPDNVIFRHVFNGYDYTNVIFLNDEPYDYTYLLESVNNRWFFIKVAAVQRGRGREPSDSMKMTFYFTRYENIKYIAEDMGRTVREVAEEYIHDYLPAYPGNRMEEFVNKFT